MRERDREREREQNFGCGTALPAMAAHRALPVLLAPAGLAQTYLRLEITPICVRHPPCPRKEALHEPYMT